jgi:L-aspartate oxidase
MSGQVGVIRSGTGLRRALAAILQLERRHPSATMRNMTTAALLVAAAAFRRSESRGGHFRSDHPNADSAQASRTTLTLKDARAVAIEAGDPVRVLAS